MYPDRARSRCALPLLLFAAACPEPYYNDDIGIPGVATAEGELAGSWAVRLRYITVAYVPVLGHEVQSGGDKYYLLERTWQATAGDYLERWRLCADINFESAGLLMTTPDATRDSVVLLDTRARVDHASGEFGTADHTELWALRNLPDLHNTPIPTPDNYRDAPQRDWIYDADNDGHVGHTMLLSGYLQGEDYYVCRKFHQLTGVIASADRVLGLHRLRSSWSVLESTASPIAVHTGEIPSDQAEQHPDPKVNWWEQARLADGADCARVRAAMDDGTLSRLRPF
ncbi:MAG: hypothetical protein JXR83_20610 [Deltaproteobacteria bacterium]|nr:hypothetical protein [Deltaproteobacteria bacterium]